ncbi:hypothetical protein F2Q68_00010078 [Brassica cretica]|uniref:Uncharacterized protein n=1 Tax=Brassica cretica TaxID=69181 RepID=A0A8S9KRC6_BRACR|nr:hypothetical protein F2Q68_00010078 [Brassica cretica]
MLSRASIDNTYGVNRILQCREDHDSRGVCSKTPTSAQPCLCQNRSTHNPRHRSTERDRHRSTTSSSHQSTRTSHIPSADAKDGLARLNTLRPQPKPLDNPQEDISPHSDDAAEPMEVDKFPTGRTLRKRKGKVAKHLKREVNEKEMESFQKRVFRILLEKPFEDAYFTHRLSMFFKETRETEEDIRRMFCEARENMKKRITLKKKSDPGEFAVPCTVKGIEFPHALCDTGASKPHASSRRIDDQVLIAACHCGAEYETEYSASIETHTETSIDNAHQKSIDSPKGESVDSSPCDWENDYYNPIMATHTRDTMHTKDYDEDYEEERAT